MPQKPEKVPNRENEFRGAAYLYIEAKFRDHILVGIRKALGEI